MEISTSLFGSTGRRSPFYSPWCHKWTDEAVRRWKSHCQMEMQWLMWHLCNHSVAESHGFYTFLSFLPSLAAYTTPPNTPHASLQFNERREYKERWGNKGGWRGDFRSGHKRNVCSLTIHKWTGYSHIPDFKVQLVSTETETSICPSSPKTDHTSVKCHRKCPQDDT